MYEKVKITIVTHADEEANYSFEAGLCSFRRHANKYSDSGYIAVHFGTGNDGGSDYNGWIYMHPTDPMFDALINLENNELIEELKGVTVESYESRDRYQGSNVFFRIIFDPKPEIEPLTPIELEIIPMIGIF